MDENGLGKPIKLRLESGNGTGLKKLIDTSMDSVSRSTWISNPDVNEKSTCIVQPLNLNIKTINQYELNKKNKLKQLNILIETARSGKPEYVVVSTSKHPRSGYTKLKPLFSIDEDQHIHLWSVDDQQIHKYLKFEFVGIQGKGTRHKVARISVYHARKIIEEKKEQNTHFVHELEQKRKEEEARRRREEEERRRREEEERLRREEEERARRATDFHRRKYTIRSTKDGRLIQVNIPLLSVPLSSAQRSLLQQEEDEHAAREAAIHLQEERESKALAAKELAEAEKAMTVNYTSFKDINMHLIMTQTEIDARDADSPEDVLRNIDAVVDLQNVQKRTEQQEEELCLRYRYFLYHRRTRDDIAELIVRFVSDRPNYAPRPPRFSQGRRILKNHVIPSREVSFEDLTFTPLKSAPPRLEKEFHTFRKQQQASKKIRFDAVQYEPEEDGEDEDAPRSKYHPHRSPHHGILKNPIALIPDTIIPSLDISQITNEDDYVSPSSSPQDERHKRVEPVEDEENSPQVIPPSSSNHDSTTPSTNPTSEDQPVQEEPDEPSPSTAPPPQPTQENATTRDGTTAKPSSSPPPSKMHSIEEVQAILRQYFPAHHYSMTSEAFAAACFSLKREIPYITLFAHDELNALPLNESVYRTLMDIHQRRAVESYGSNYLKRLLELNPNVSTPPSNTPVAAPNLSTPPQKAPASTSPPSKKKKGLFSRFFRRKKKSK